jgi:formate dehydrogenase major subunit
MKTFSRREFIQISGGTIAGIALSGSLPAKIIQPVEEKVSGLRILHAKQTTTICPYCSVSCGIIVHTINGKVVNTEGTPIIPSMKNAAQGMSVPAFPGNRTAHKTMYPGAISLNGKRGFMVLPWQNRQRSEPGQDI